MVPAAPAERRSIRTLQSGDDPENRALAATGRTKQRNELARKLAELLGTDPRTERIILVGDDTPASRAGLQHDDIVLNPGVWRHGDWCELTEHDGMIIYGRSDATLNPGGVRIGTAEIYRQVEQLPEIVESVAIGQETGEGASGDVQIVLFVRLREGETLNDALRDKIRKQIKDNTSPLHVPKKILEVSDIPRTISGKISELAVRDVVHGRPVTNTEALANPESLEIYKSMFPSA